MKVSIIIPVYNSNKYIYQTLSKLKNQTWKNLEIIIVNDGSTDNTKDEIEKFISNNTDFDVTLINVENGGAAKARNIGLKKATGDYIQFLDADDYMSDDKIENQLRIVVKSENPEKTLIFCKYANDYGNKIKIPNNRVVHQNYYKPHELLFNFWEYKKFNVIHSYLIPKSIINKSGEWDEGLSTNDDGEFMSRVILQSKQVVFDEKSTVYYMFLKDSLSKQKSRKHYLSRLLSYKKIRNNLYNVISNTKELESLYSKLVADCIVEIFAKDKMLYRDEMKGYYKYLSFSSLKIFRFLKRLLNESIIEKFYNYNLYRLDNKIS